MKQNVADFLVNRLLEWGVKRIFGLPGDGINGIMGAFNRAEDKFEFVQARHEEMAASWPADMPSSPARSASAWRPPDREPFTC